MPVSAIVLAAGMSRRYKGVKMLHLIDGVPMIKRVVDTVLASGFNEVIVVTGYEAPAVEAVLPEGVRVVRNAEFAEGMGTSIATGVSAAKGAGTGYLIVPGDMPFLTAATMVALADGTDPDRLAACRGAEGPETPAYFGHAYRQDLERLTGDQGARPILTAHPQNLHLITVDQSELQDIDEPHEPA